MEERIVTPHQLPEDEAAVGAPVNLRPTALSEFVGQKQVCENLKIFIEAAKMRREALDHVLLFGPPGLGKTTLASIIAKELDVNFKATSAPMISKSGDLAAILTNLEANDVLFIDEIHRLNPAIEEVLYSAMEDFQLDLIIGEGPSARRALQKTELQQKRFHHFFNRVAFFRQSRGKRVGSDRTAAVIAGNTAEITFDKRVQPEFVHIEPA